MTRPKRCRRVCFDPDFKVFKPQGIPTRGLDSIEMELDELEAIRLSDLEGLSQAEAAKCMDVSQPTFSRILSGARSKTAAALTHGKAIKIARNVPHTCDLPNGRCGCPAARTSKDGDNC